MSCYNDMAACRYADEQGQLSEREAAMEQELERIKAQCEPTLRMVLEAAFIDALDGSSDPLFELFVEQWKAGNKLALQIADDKRIMTELTKIWESEK